MPTDTDARAEFEHDWNEAAKKIRIMELAGPRMEPNRIVADIPFAGRTIVHTYPQPEGDYLVVIEYPWERAYRIPRGTYLSLTYLIEKFGAPEGYNNNGTDLYAVAHCIATLNNSPITQL